MVNRGMSVCLSLSLCVCVPEMAISLCLCCSLEDNHHVCVCVFVFTYVLNGYACPLFVLYCMRLCAIAIGLCRRSRSVDSDRRMCVCGVVPRTGR